MACRTTTALFLIGILTACGRQGTQQAIPIQQSPPLQITATTAVHYLDNTGCVDFPSGDYWNRRVDGASVSSSSAAQIAYAYSHESAAPNLNAHYTYEVVSPSATLYHVSSTSYHKIPANAESPALGGWPVSSAMNGMLTTTDKVSIILQQTSSPSDCRGWNGYGFTGSGTTYSAYTGDHVEMNKNMPAETCNGAASLCGEDLEGDLTYYELNANTGNSPSTVTHPILHAIHTEFPCALAGTCGTSNTYSFNHSFNCRTSCARLRLRAGLVARPTDPNAAALYDALVHYGVDTSETGCCWGFYTMVRTGSSGYPTTIPSAVSSFASKLRLNDFEVLANGTW